jgi:hypothetical protein
MIKNCLLLLALSTALTATAQKKHFFDAYQGGMILDQDNFSPTPRDWSQLTKAPYTTPYNPDSMGILERRFLNILPNWRFGLVVGAQKNLGRLVKSKKQNRLSWATQLQFAGGRFSTLTYADQKYFGSPDTADYTGYTTSISYQKASFNLYNVINYNFKSLLFKKIEYNIGIGLSAGIGFNSGFTETISATDYRWVRQQFIAGFTANATRKSIVERPVKNTRHISLIVPFGATWNVSKQVAVSLQHHYVLMGQRPGYSKPRSSLVNDNIEGYQLHFTVLYRPGMQ